MVSAYIQAAMSRAHYEIVNDPDPFYGEIPECRGVWAVGQSLEECRQTLQESLEGWLVLRLQKGLDIPELDGIRFTAEEPAMHE